MEVYNGSYCGVSFTVDDKGNATLGKMGEIQVLDGSKRDIADIMTVNFNDYNWKRHSFDNVLSDCFKPELDMSLLPFGIKRLFVAGTVVLEGDCRALFRGYWEYVLNGEVDYKYSPFYNLEVLDLFNLDTSRCIYMDYVCYGLNDVKSIDVSNFDTSNVRSFVRMFDGCYRLEYLDLSNWDTSNAVDMRGMFFDCCSLEELDLSSWGTSSLDAFGGMYMLDGCDSLDRLVLNTENQSFVWDIPLKTRIDVKEKVL